VTSNKHPHSMRYFPRILGYSNFILGYSNFRHNSARNTLNSPPTHGWCNRHNVSQRDHFNGTK